MGKSASSIVLSTSVVKICSSIYPNIKFQHHNTILISTVLLPWVLSAHRLWLLELSLLQNSFFMKKMPSRTATHTSLDTSVGRSADLGELQEAMDHGVAVLHILAGTSVFEEI